MKVLNFGSLNIDYVYSVDHFVRAGETIASDGLELFCGGKGLNQSVAFSKAGASVCHAGCIGSEGGMLREMLISAGVDVSHVKTLEGVPTGHAIIQVNRDGENCIMLFGGANQAVTDAQIAEVMKDFGEGDLLVLQNEINSLDKIIKSAKKKGLTVVLNPSPFNPVITSLELSLVDSLIINETEGKELTGETDKDEIISALLGRYPNMKIVLTLGSKGAVYADKDTRAFSDIVKATVVDTTAAGDTFTGYFYTSLMSGKTPEESLRIASAASSVTVSRKGAAPSIPTMSELIDLGLVSEKEV